MVGGVYLSGGRRRRGARGAMMREWRLHWEARERDKWKGGKGVGQSAACMSRAVRKTRLVINIRIHSRK